MASDQQLVARILSGDTAAVPELEEKYRSSLIEVAQSFAATRWQIITKVLIPSAVPFMLTGIRLAIGRGIVGVVVGELFGARAGLGYLIFTAGQTFDVPTLFVGVITLAVAGVSLTFLAQLVEKRALRWRRSVMED